MTVDDDSSIYVGGLPYDATEDSLRRIFDLYGAVVAVKIINDRSTRGKCYGFVTFTNPRSAIDAIKDMDGRTIEGRVVRVNGVNTRGGGRFGRESNRFDVERDVNWERDRDRGRDYEHDRYRRRGRNNDWSRERDRSREHDLDKERAYEHSQDRDLPKDILLDRNPELEKIPKANEQERDLKLSHGQDWEKDHDADWNGGGGIDNTDDYDKSLGSDRDQLSRRDNGLAIEGRTARELSSDSSDDYIHELKEQLEISTERFEELRKEISQIEERTGEKGKLVVELQKKAKKLEDALISAKKRSSFRQMQLTKLHKSFLLVKDYSERLKISEQELQALVESTAIESDVG
ncbi:U1 small nuclear ribonucleoprotein 70 kDa [Cucurbita pepo subsp. pepo]|uniref:U1 small nuclear ribonucleoprotein 70 kDa n=1 Tax=Cucurbita pepo subsp. pepo TaxID=3664 RepID=UPI000C9D6051|nr:U1 small nuclear ribonucleoprotein 70 kDa [Cucurbita pepo subsp. pepo]